MSALINIEGVLYSPEVLAQKLSSRKDAVVYGFRDVAALIEDSVQVEHLQNTTVTFERGASLIRLDIAERASVLLRHADKLLNLARQYASECGECNGTGLVTIYNYVHDSDADDQPCAQCADIRAVIAKAQS